jgi:acyl dehydratase
MVTMMSTASICDSVGQELGVSDWLTLDQALVDRFAEAICEAMPLDELPCVVHHGLDRIRFTAPLPVGEDVRLRARLEDVFAGPAALTLRVGLTFEVQGDAKPVCAATWLLRAYPGDHG